MMEIIDTIRGGQKLCYEGNMYTKKTEHRKENIISWRCVNHATKCPAFRTTDKEMTTTELVIEHNHKPDEQKIFCEKTKQAMKRSAETSLGNPNQIYSEILAGVPEELKPLLNEGTCKRLMRRIRAAKNCSEDPLEDTAEVDISNEHAEDIPADNPSLTEVCKLGEHSGHSAEETLSLTSVDRLMEVGKSDELSKNSPVGTPILMKDGKSDEDVKNPPVGTPLLMEVGKSDEDVKNPPVGTPSLMEVGKSGEDAKNSHAVTPSLGRVSKSGDHAKNSTPNVPSLNRVVKSVEQAKKSLPVTPSLSRVEKSSEQSKTSPAVTPSSSRVGKSSEQVINSPANTSTSPRFVKPSKPTKEYPVDPSSLAELEISSEWQMTSGGNPVKFLLFDNGADSDERVLVFSRDKHIQKLVTADTWCMHANYSMAPHLFKQLFLIQARVGTVFLPIAYVLLQYDKKSSYEILFQKFKELGCDPAFVLIDFDKTVELALSEVFGSQLQVKYCFCHLTKSVWKKIQSLGLERKYQEDLGFRLFCGKLDALALLPLAEIKEGMDHIKTTAPDEAKLLVEYFDINYVSGCSQQSESSDQLVNIEQVPPMFSPEKWNIHEMKPSGKSGTNYVCGGWNHNYSFLVGHDHPNVFRLIDFLRVECTRCESILRMIEQGIKPNDISQRLNNDVHNRLHTYYNDRLAGRNTIPEFLQAVSHNFRGKEEISI